MERGHKNISQMARELEPLPAAWSEMSIPDAMHLLHLPAASPVTTAGLRQALEIALERAKFDEIPVLLGAYRILEGHFGGPEGSATRQDDPTSASWPATSGATGFTAVELEAWEDDPSITVSDIRMIEPASIRVPGVRAANSGLQGLGSGFEADTDPARIVIDDFNLGQHNPQAVGAQRTMPKMPKVVKMQPANSRSTRARHVSVPAVLAVGIAGLLVVWAYHPFAQSLVSNLFGQTPQPTQAVIAEPVLAAKVPLIEKMTPASESVSNEPIMVQVPKTPTVQASAVNDQLNSSEPNLKVQTQKPIASKPDSSKPDSSKPDSSKPDSSKPDSSKSDSSKSDSSKSDSSIAPARVKTLPARPATARPATARPAKAALPNVSPVKNIFTNTARKVKAQTKPSFGAARPATASPSRTVLATARKPRVTKPRPIKPRPIKTQSTLIGSQTAKRAIQSVTNAVTQVPKATAGKPLRVSRQADAGRASKSGTNANGSTKPKPLSPNVDTSITNPIKLASSNERDAAAARAIANPQPVSSIQTPKASGRIDNLSREEFGQRYFNRKLFEVWKRDGAKLRYGNWDEVPLELQILENNLFRSAIYLNGPGGNEAKDNEKPVLP